MIDEITQDVEDQSTAEQQQGALDAVGCEDFLRLGFFFGPKIVQRNFATFLPAESRTWMYFPPLPPSTY